MRLLLSVVTMLAVAACHDIDDLNAKPAIWTGTFEGRYDKIAGCLALRSHGLFIGATPMIDTDERRAEVVVYNASSGSVLWKYDLRAITSTTTEVSVRNIYRNSPISSMPEDVRRCAKTT